MLLKILIENSKPDGSELIAEHGLSFFVDTGRTQFIFDCGHTGAAFDNAKIMGVDLRGINFAVLSHSHYDHAGGFPKLLNFAPIKTLYTGKHFWSEKFSRTEDGFKYRGCGFDKNFLAARGIEQKICREIFRLEENCWLAGKFNRRYDFETISEKFVRADKKHGGEKIPDNFRDEIILVLRGGEGLAVVTACAHSGILNIVADVRERFSAQIHTVIGGLHLTGATPERISRTIDELKILGVKKILPCHCSGEAFMKNFSDRIFTGSVIVL